MPHCIKTIPRAAFLEPSSLFIQAIAATQGVYSNVNIKNTKAVKGVNKVDNEEVFPPNNTVNVLTTLSFAVSPVSFSLILNAFLSMMQMQKRCHTFSCVTPLP